MLFSSKSISATETGCHVSVSLSSSVPRPQLTDLPMVTDDESVHKA